MSEWREVSDGMPNDGTECCIKLANGAEYVAEVYERFYSKSPGEFIPIGGMTASKRFPPIIKWKPVQEDDQ